jgi:hypothetical protein
LPVQAARASAAAGLRRGAAMAVRSGALFTLQPNGGRAATALGVEARASGLPTRWESAGMIDAGRGGALFVPLERGEGRDPAVTGPR